MLTEINQWQSNKTTSLTTTNTLSLEMLWENVLKNPNHPIAMDPDQCISDILITSVLSSGSIDEVPILLYITKEFNYNLYLEKTSFYK